MILHSYTKIIIIYICMYLHVYVILTACAFYLSKATRIWLNFKFCLLVG